jgi:hypothetical protein
MKHAHRLAGWVFFGFVVAATGCNRGMPSTSEDTKAELGVVSPSRNVEINVPAHLRGGQVEVARAGNMRYIGALPTIDGRHLRPRVLLRSGRLAMVNDEGYAEMIRLGIASVIDFRSGPEGRAAPDAPWVLRTTRHVTIELPEVEPNSADSYLQMLYALEPMLPKLFAHLGAKSALPALLHCGTGRGRACAGMAIVLLALGVSSSEVAGDFANNQEVGADPKWLDGVFARIAASGGIDAYLQAHSVDRANVDSLREQALE